MRLLVGLIAVLDLVGPPALLTLGVRRLQSRLIQALLVIAWITFVVTLLVGLGDFSECFNASCPHERLYTTIQTIALLAALAVQLVALADLLRHRTTSRRAAAKRL